MYIKNYDIHNVTQTNYKDNNLTVAFVIVKLEKHKFELLLAIFNICARWLQVTNTENLSNSS